ncbi:MAG: hypothetical protein FWE11_10930, partial [Defluviitaleaceae bacterium]|nr:hypothetical protein [Defluviitaleaceae bacterium]
SALPKDNKPSPTDEKLSLPMKKYWRGEYFVCLCHCGSYCWDCGAFFLKIESVTFLVLTKVSGHIEARQLICLIYCCFLWLYIVPFYTPIGQGFWWVLAITY